MALLDASSVNKSYGGVTALRDVSFELRGGEVHALVGENGAGKSTLVGIFAGRVPPDSGVISIDGVPVTDHAPSSARAHGVHAIYQQPALFPDLSVAENIALSLESQSPLAPVNWRRRRLQARDLLARAAASIDPERTVSSLSIAEQQLVAIATAVGARARVLILDEPTACLSAPEIDALFALVGELRGQGAGIIYISHKLDELPRIADRVTVLRDGRRVETREMAAAPAAELIRLMVGRELSAIFPKQDVAPGATAVEGRGLGCRRTGLHDVDFTIRAGEILGVAGLIGSGRTALAQTLFGLEPADAGQILLGGRAVAIDAPATARALGIAYVPEDRGRCGVIGAMSVAENVTLTDLAGVSSRGFVNREREDRVAEHSCERLGIKTRGVRAAVSELSGGNQQKVAVAKWLSRGARVMILDEPTQGVDVGAKAEIHRLVSEMAADGLAVMLISSDLPEVLGMSDRVAVMAGGTIVGTMHRGDATPEKILSMSLGGMRKPGTS